MSRPPKRGRADDRDLDDLIDTELEDHLLREAAANREAGMSDDEALRAAKASFGGVVQAREQVRRVWRPQALTDLVRDMGFGLRILWRWPGYAALVVVTLALAVGANAAVFAMVDAIWLRPRPVAEPERLVFVSSVVAASPQSMNEVLKKDTLDALRSLPVFVGVGGQVTTRGTLGDWRSQMVFDSVGGYAATLAVTDDYFDVLKVTIRGRGFRHGDDRQDAAAVAAISDRLWRAGFGARDDLVGSTVQTSHMPVTIVGIAAPDFHGARLGEHYDVWIPASLVPRVGANAGVPDSAEFMTRLTSFSAIARLRDGVSLADARNAVEVAHDASALPARNPAGLVLQPLAEVYGPDTTATVLLGDLPVLRLVWIAASLVLLLSAATLALLLFVHYERRRAELAARLAIGASRGRVTRQIAAELFALAVPGLGIALLVAALALRIAQTLTLPNGVDLSLVDLQVDGRVVSIACASTLGTMALASLVPWIRLLRRPLVRDLAAASGAGIAASLRWRRTLLAFHVAATVLLLTAAALLGRTVYRAYTRAPGFDVNRVLFAVVQPSTGTFVDPVLGEDGWHDRELTAYNGMVTGIANLPGVRTVAYGTSPLSPAAPGPATGLAVDGHVREVPHGYRSAVPGYLKALGVPLLSGRDIQVVEGTDDLEVVVTRSFAEELWPEQDPIDRRFGNSADGARNYRVVGVSADYLQGSVRSGLTAGMVVAGPGFRGFTTAGSPSTGLVIGTDVPADRIKTSVRDAIESTFPGANRIELQTGADIVAADLGRERLGAFFFMGFGVISLALAIAGVFGLTAYLIESRRHELGIRLALGATPQVLTRTIVRTSLFPVVLGAVLGLGLALIASRAVAALVHGIPLHDPVSFAGAFLVTTTAAVAAALVAALRLRSLAPSRVLHAE